MIGLEELFGAFLHQFACAWMGIGFEEMYVGRADRAAECLRIEAHLLNAGIERGLNKYSCGMLELRELLMDIK